MTVDVAVAVFVGVAFLFVFYRAVQSDWPESYFGARDISAYAISATPLRYVLFHVLPVYIVCVFVAVSVDRIGRSGALPGVLVGAIHGGLTLGRALIVWIRSDVRERRHRGSIALMRALVLIGVVITAVAAVASRDVFEPVVPSLQDLNTALWTALLAGVAGAFVVRVAGGNALDPHELVLKSLASPPKIFLRQLPKELRRMELIRNWFER